VILNDLVFTNSLTPKSTAPAMWLR